MIRAQCPACGLLSAQMEASPVATTINDRFCRRCKVYWRFRCTPQSIFRDPTAGAVYVVTATAARKTKLDAWKPIVVEAS